MSDAQPAPAVVFKAYKLPCAAVCRNLCDFPFCKFFVMGKLTLFALLVLSLFQASVVALPRLFARGEGIFPDVNWGGLIMGGAAALEGINLLLRPDESDRSGTVPQPDVLSASGLSKAAPTLPPLGSSSNSAPLYKLEIHNGPLPTLKDGAGTTEAPSQGVDNQCDPSSVSLI